MSIHSKVQDILQEHLGSDRADLTPEATFENLGADFLDTIKIIISCEEEFGLEIPDLLPQEIKTILDLTSFIHTATN